MRTFGLIGYPLSHSFSEKYFSEKFKKEGITDAVYKPFPLENISEFTHLDEQQELSGLNVTIPYKEKIIPFLDEQDDPVKKIKAVNTIKFIKKNNTIVKKGFNTDVYGFTASIRPLLDSKHTKALVLGTGGASKAVEYGLKQMGIDVLFISRNPKGKQHTISYEEINKEIIQQHLLIINTSPLGMYPKEETYPGIPYQFLSSDHVLYDLVYNPEITKFMDMGKQWGTTVKNGYDMLILQAEKAWEIWNS